LNGFIKNQYEHREKVGEKLQADYIAGNLNNNKFTAFFDKIYTFDFAN